MKDQMFKNLSSDQLVRKACSQLSQDLTSKIFSSLFQSLSPQVPDSTSLTKPRPEDQSSVLSSLSKKAKPYTQVHSSSQPSKPKPPRPNKKKSKSSRNKKQGFWDRSHMSPSHLTNESDFPPLSNASNPTLECESLHKEIIKFGDSTYRKVQEKFQYIYLMLSKIDLLVAEQVGGCIRLFGSYATGLAIDSSDIDLGVIGVNIHNRQFLHSACLSLSNSLKLLPFVQSSVAILTAKIPVIKVQVDLQCFSGIPSPGLVDISFVETFECAHQGFQAISFTKDLLILFPSIRYLTMVLKNFLYSIGLNSSYHGRSYLGGLSSYSLILWITASLNSMKTVPEDYGAQLEYFLDFFGNKFNPKVFGVNVVNRGSLFVLDSNSNEHAVTIDPNNNNNNTTRSSYKVSEVLCEFAQAHSRMKEIMSKGKRKPTLKQIFKKFNR